MLGAQAHAATDVKSASARLSDEAFALLTAVSKNPGSPSPALGPVGVFAADTQKLSAALAAGDRGGAAGALASLKADAVAVDKAAGSGALDSSKWSAIKRDLASLAAQVPAAPAGGADANAASPEAGPAAPAPLAPAPAVSAPIGNPSDLAVEVDSARMVGNDVLRVQGYVKGRAIRSAGIYSGEDRLASLNLKPPAGSQMVRFQLDIRNPVAGAVIRIYDRGGRSAEAPITGAAEIARPPTEPETSNADSGASAPAMNPTEEMASTGGDLSSESNPAAPDVSEGNTEEIPAAVPPPSAPKRRMQSHLRSIGPNDISIRIDALSRVDPGLREYQIRGQIAGSNLQRAGIYVDRRLSQQIPLNAGSGFHISTFAQNFDAVGSEVTIRVYRSRHDYTESSINLATAGSGTAMAAAPLGAVPLGASPMVINPLTANTYGAEADPNQLAVQITSVQPAASTLYVVSGIISGRNIASAGIYQNGGLIQAINVGASSGITSGLSGGLSGLISGIIPGASRQIPFTARFNPMQGMATVRVYDRGGTMTEQPVIAAGIPYAPNPYGYGAVNPYGRNPYTGTASGIGLAPGIGVSPSRGMPTGPGVTPW